MLSSVTTVVSQALRPHDAREDFENASAIARHGDELALCNKGVL